MTYRIRHISELIPEAVFSLQRRRAAVQKSGVSAGEVERTERSSRLSTSDRQEQQAAAPAPPTAQAA